jgi:hypothetical protein
MFRIRLPDGSLSVIINMTRAKDAMLDYEAKAGCIGGGGHVKRTGSRDVN